MSGTASTFSEERHSGPLQTADSVATAGRRLLRRPTLVETERIARECPPEGLSVSVIVQAIQREVGCSRATAYRAVSDAFAAGILSWSENVGSPE
jgi:hypothetical protein